VTEVVYVSDLAFSLLPPDHFSLLAVASAALCHAFSAFASITEIHSCSFWACLASVAAFLRAIALAFLAFARSHLFCL